MVLADDDDSAFASCREDIGAVWTVEKVVVARKPTPTWVKNMWCTKAPAKKYKRIDLLEEDMVIKIEKVTTMNQMNE